MATTYGTIPSSTRTPVSASIRDQGVGIALPIGGANVGGYFQQTYTKLDMAKTNLKNLLLTMKGERVMHPELGSGLYELLFEPIQDEETMIITIKSIINETVRTWLPYLNINDVVIELETDSNRINISITLSLKNDPITQDTLFLSVSRGDF